MNLNPSGPSSIDSKIQFPNGRDRAWLLPPPSTPLSSTSYKGEEIEAEEILFQNKPYSSH